MTATTNRAWSLTVDDDSDNLEEILGKIIGDSAALSKVNTIELERDLARTLERREAITKKVEKRTKIEETIRQRLERKRLEYQRTEQVWRKARSKTRAVSSKLMSVSEENRNLNNTLQQERSFLDNFANVYTEDAFKNRAFMVMSIRDKIDSTVPVRLVDDPVAKELKLSWHTGDIYINDPNGVPYDVNFGKFAVSVVLRYARGNRIVDTLIHGAGNNKEWHGEYLHPHIQVSGNPCLGNVQRMLIEHMANQDVAQVIYTITEYLCHYNHADPYKKLMYWGVANPLDLPRMSRMEPYLEFDSGPKRECGLSESDCLVLHSVSKDGSCFSKEFEAGILDTINTAEQAMQKLKESLNNGESNIQADSTV